MPGGTRRKEKSFDMHPKLLMDVIRRQAGTLGKAVLEGVMNSVDAHATFCDVVVDNEVIIIEDDGDGFPDEATVDKYFNTFGQPHEEGERKVYANFRMGRGQMFAFGHNIWESGRLTFDVDIDQRGSRWLYSEDEDTGVAGCRITIYLYDRLLPSALGQLERELRQLVKWVAIPVTLNDEQISQDPAEAHWDYESENCYVKLRTPGDLHVYNLGVYVKSFSENTWGRGGEVVSKQQLMLNFARNDVMVTKCPIWQEVKKFVASQANAEISRKKALSEAERQHLASRFRAEDLPLHEFLDLKLFTDVLGRHHSARELARKAWQYPCYTVAVHLDRRGDRVHQEKLAFVFSDRTLQRWGRATAEGLWEFIREVLLRARLLYGDNKRWCYRPFEEVSQGIGKRFDLLPAKEWNAKEQLVVRLADYHGRGISQAVARVMGLAEVSRRRIKIGVADTADGWTDGQAYIALNRNWIRELQLSRLSDFVRLGNLLLHEYCHDSADWESHSHGPDFYQNFHDASDCVGPFAEAALRSLPKMTARLGKQPNIQQLRGQDQVELLDKCVAEFAEKLEG